MYDLSNLSTTTWEVSPTTTTTTSTSYVIYDANVYNCDPIDCGAYYTTARIGVPFPGSLTLNKFYLPTDTPFNRNVYEPYSPYAGPLGPEIIVGTTDYSTCTLACFALPDIYYFIADKYSCPGCTLIESDIEVAATTNLTLNQWYIKSDLSLDFSYYVKSTTTSTPSGQPIMNSLYGTSCGMACSGGTIG